MRLLLIGGSGFVGSALAVGALKRGYEVACTYAHAARPSAVRSYRVDLSRDDNALETALARTKPDVVVYCAVATSDETLCRQVNVTGVARTLAHLGPETRFVYLSTNAVFSGLNGPYSEADEPDAERCDTPHRVYGVTKAAGEEVALQRPNTLVVRTATVDGYYPDGELSDRLKFLVSRLKQRKRLERFSDRFITPTMLANLADALSEMLAPGFSYRGILHVAGTERLTDFDYAKTLARHLKVDETLVGESSSEVAFGAGACLRDTSLSVSLAQGLLETKLLSVQEQFEWLFRKKNYASPR